MYVGTSVVNIHEVAVIKHLVKYIFASGACSKLPTPTEDGSRIVLTVVVVASGKCKEALEA